MNVWDVVEKMDVEQVNNGQHRSKYTQYKQKQNKSADIPFLLFSTDFTINARQKNL